MTAEDTKTPWHIDAGETYHAAHYVLDENNQMIARFAKSNSAIADERDRAHAAHAVHCVNAHDGLVGACRDAFNAMDAGEPSPNNTHIDNNGWREVLAKLDDALAQEPEVTT